VSGRRVLVVFFTLLVAAVGFIFWMGATGGGTANRPASSASTESGASASSSASSASAAPAAPALEGPAKHLRDRRVRDELRQRILAGWAAEDAADDETRIAAKAGRFVPRPNAEGRGIDPKYIQEVVREDLFPMARQCYEELIARKPDAGGRLEMELTIAGDDAIGGIVEEASLAKTSSLKDEKMETCIRESLLTLSFPPPAHDDVVTVVYPIVFSPEDEEKK
jgi:hypothetical protein